MNAANSIFEWDLFCHFHKSNENKLPGEFDIPALTYKIVWYQAKLTDVKRTFYTENISYKNKQIYWWPKDSGDLISKVPFAKANYIPGHLPE